MLFNEDDPTSSNNMDYESKVNIEETLVNLGCVKKEFDEDELAFEEIQYKIALTFDNIFGESSIGLVNNRDTLIGFVDGDVIMEAGSLKLEENKDLIQKNIEQFDCNRCGGNFEGYYPNCSSLSHILNNVTPNINPEPVLNTAPINMVEIREVSTRQAVFALKTLPKGVILGPFEGVAPIENTTGFQWKIKDKKFVNDQNGNWMKYIGNVGNHASKNLDVFQFDGVLYFQTIREIQEGEELLVCYREERDEVLKSDKEEEFYLVPVKKEEYPKVFACTLCCLGFRLERCLLEHKTNCPLRQCGGSSEDFKIIQCCCCKVWLEKQEHHESHMLHCLENYTRLCRNRNFAPTNAEEDENVHEDDEITTSIDVDANYSTPPTEIMNSNNSFFRSNFKVHKEEYFDDDIGTTHSNTNGKAHKCSECSYQTNVKVSLKNHLVIHNDIKHFQCDICKKRFTCKRSVTFHIKNKHSNTSEKDYKCGDCSFQTNYQRSLKDHMDTHNDIKHFQCDICKQRFCQKSNLKLHIKNKHSNTSEKEYKCSECLYQTNCKSNLKNHLGTHTGIKDFQCDICKQKFGQKNNLELHIKNKHLNTSEKDYKCADCSFQTYYKSNLKDHMDTHNDIKRFQCDICEQRFRQKNHLKMHIKNQHSNRSEKEYKCSECCYQTNRKDHLKVHFVSHTDVKNFQCDICKRRFGQKNSLQRHIKNIHSNTNGKE